MAVVTSRYARALADVVFDMKLDYAQTLQQVRSIVDLTNSSAELRHVWENPSIPADQKRNLLDAFAGRLGLSKPVRNFMAVLIDHHRVHQLQEIAQLFEHEMNDRLGMAEAVITSARELTSAERSEMETKISTMTGKRVQAKYATDANLLGGATVRLGSTIYDGSVRGQLQKIKEALSS